MNKKTYLVKKNPLIKENDPKNWIIMDCSEFISFLQTEEGKRRKANFYRLDACSENDSILYIECDEENGRSIRKEMNRKRYSDKNMEGMSGEVSYDHSNYDEVEDYINDVLVDDNCMEEEVCDRLTLEKVKQAVDSLTGIARDAVLLYYMAEKPMGEQEFANMHGISQPAAHYWKQKAIKSLRIQLGVD